MVIFLLRRLFPEGRKSICLYIKAQRFNPTLIFCDTITWAWRIQLIIYLSELRWFWTVLQDWLLSDWCQNSFLVVSEEWLIFPWTKCVAACRWAGDRSQNGEGTELFLLESSWWICHGSVWRWRHDLHVWKREQVYGTHSGEILTFPKTLSNL